MTANSLAALEKKIDDKSILLGVIGLGYVGLPVALAFLGKNIRVLAFDIDSAKIDTLLQGESYLRDMDTGILQASLKAGRFSATADFARLSEPDALLICVPTPLAKNREPDLTFVSRTALSVSKALRPGQLVVLESTTYPGTTVEVLQPILEQSGLRAELDFALAYSPERVDPGNKNYSLGDIPKLVSGVGPASGEMVRKLYAIAFRRVVPVSSTRVAETAKLLENIFRSVNIALVNELKILCQRMGIDIWEVIEAAATKPFGFMPFYPGPGLGGHCIPIDPFYLASKAREYEVSTKFIELAGEVNTTMPHYVVQRLMEALNGRQKALNGSRVLVIGVAYKRDVDDCRESPSFKIIEILQSKGAEVSYNDPYVQQIKPVRNYSLAMQSTTLTRESLEAADCVLIATDHSVYDYDFILKHARLIVDTRNVYAGKHFSSDRIFSA